MSGLTTLFRRRHYTPFERRHRMAARLALYGSLVLIGALTFAGWSYIRRPLNLGTDQEWYHTDYAAMPSVDLLRRYVRIDTTKETGDEVAGAEFLASQLEAAGIPAHIERMGHRRANLWAILEGADPKAVVLHNHIDVEPIHHPEQWKYPPFSATIDPPSLFGRGVFDMKSVAIAQLLAMIDLKKSGAPLRRSVIFLATSSEESGSTLGTQWILAQHPELVSRFWAVLTEGGVVEARTPEDVKYWGIEFGQKRYVDLHVCAETRERLEQLAEDLKQTARPETGLELTPPVAKFLAAYAPSRDRSELRQLLGHPELVVSDLREFERLPPFLRAFFRDEAHPFDIERTPGGGWEMLIKLHLLSGDQPEEARRALVPDWMLGGLPHDLQVEGSADVVSPTDNPVFQAAVDLLQHEYPGATVGPYYLPWTETDARWFRAAGIPTYGFSPFLILSSDTFYVGNADERMALPGYVSGVRVYSDLLQKIAG
jgi:acetylornithine deacetylase/succinyl-diaminopimelate desuccinylase-like protein